MTQPSDEQARIKGHGWASQYGFRNGFVPDAALTAIGRALLTLEAEIERLRGLGLDAVQTGRDEMRAVVEAAERWVDKGTNEDGSVRPSRALMAAVAAYRARVAAPEGGK